MNTPKFARVALLTALIALVSGCSTTNKTSASSPAADTATPAKDSSAISSITGVFSRASWIVFGVPASGAPGYQAPVAANTPDAYKALAAASANLDEQLQAGKITPAQYKEKSAELSRLYGQGK